MRNFSAYNHAGVTMHRRGEILFIRGRDKLDLRRGRRRFINFHTNHAGSFPIYPSDLF